MKRDVSILQHIVTCITMITSSLNLITMHYFYVPAKKVFAPIYYPYFIRINSWWFETCQWVSIKVSVFVQKSTWSIEKEWEKRMDRWLKSSSFHHESLQIQLVLNFNSLSDFSPKILKATCFPYSDFPIIFPLEFLQGSDRTLL